MILTYVLTYILSSYLQLTSVLTFLLFYLLLTLFASIRTRHQPTARSTNHSSFVLDLGRTYYQRAKIQYDNQLHQSASISHSLNLPLKIKKEQKQN